MSKFFITRPIFAIVIALVIVIVGLAVIPRLPVATYPEVVPPVVQIIASYRGANSQDVEKSVAQPIEQQLVGLDGMLYFFSRCSNDGTLTIDVTFKLGTDADLAAVKTQNKVSLATPALPPEVQRVGVSVKKVSSALLMVIGISAPDGRYDSLFLNNFATINVVDRINSIPGVGDTRLGASQSYGMRIWVDPDKLAKFGVTATDVSSAIQAQNRQNPAGAIGQPPVPLGTDFQYPVNAIGRLVEPQDFSDIVVRAAPGGSYLRVGDIGRVELGAEDYKTFSRLNSKPASIIIVNLAPGANAVDTAKRVRAYLVEASKSFPAGLEYSLPYDATLFVKASIRDVLQTLLEAIGLVTLVVFLFLQNWRASLIPLLTIPVSVIGTMALFPLLGFSINMTSMFGLVLAIGIVVDDAIVVVEAVELNIERGLSVREATIKAMEEVSGPVAAIAVILGAVFVPVSFLGGISGQIYRQFALTIAASVMFSALNALTLSPALSALLLRPRVRTHGLLARFFEKFNSGFNWMTDRYVGIVRFLIRNSIVAVVMLALPLCLAVWLFKTLPGGFLPDEDQGVFFAAVRLPDGASLERNLRVVEQAESVIKAIPGVATVTAFGGLDITTSTNNSNVSTVIATLKPWEERTTPELQLPAILQRAQQGFGAIKDAVIFGFGLPPILGLSPAGGFEFMLEDRAGGQISQLASVMDELVAGARKRPEIAGVFSSFRNSIPQFEVKLDREKAQSLGVPVSDVYDSLQTFLGGLYVNDFNRFGRTWRVLMQAEPQFRIAPEDVGRFYVRAAREDMVPLNTLLTLNSVSGPEVIYRYNRFRTAEIMGQPAPGYSSGDAAKAIEELAKHLLPQGYGFEWTGTVYQQRETEGQEGFTFGLAAILVFLFLAALYESWSIPFAVVLAVPLGLFGALLAVFLRSYAYDIYTQIGIVTLIGLAAKNAILIVEYAKIRRDRGATIRDASIEAAHLRIRPILMTSFAFLLGVLPLVLASGAGAASRRALGTTVFGGMNAATLLAVFIVPVLYVIIAGITGRTKEPGLAAVAQEEGVKQ